VLSIYTSSLGDYVIDFWFDGAARRTALGEGGSVGELGARENVIVVVLEARAAAFGDGGSG